MKITTKQPLAMSSEGVVENPKFQRLINVRERLQCIGCDPSRHFSTMAGKYEDCVVRAYLKITLWCIKVCTKSVVYV